MKKEMERQNFIGRRQRRISWGSIFAGVFTVMAISVLLSILAASIGLFQFDALDNNPTSGIGVTFGIITAISLLLSMAAGGFVAGKLAGADGMIHGFIVWATSMIATLIIGAFLAVGTVKLSANILGSVSSAVGSIVSGVGSTVGDALSGLGDEADSVFGNIDLSSNKSRQEVRQDIRRALRQSGVKEFQPEYIESQMNAVQSDLRQSVKRLVKNPKDADVIINRFLDRLSTRTEKAFQNVNRDDLTRAIANNTSMTKAEVDRAVDDYEDIFNATVAEAKEQVENLKGSIEQAKQDWEEMKMNALQGVNDASNAAARSALIAFFALLIGAAIAAFMGAFGVGKTQEGYEV